MRFAIGFILAFTAHCHGANIETSLADQFPHQVAIFYRADYICGGSIININPGWILTAAHCVHARELVFQLLSKIRFIDHDVLIRMFDFFIVAGINSLAEDGAQRKIKGIIEHEAFKDFRNDIALMQLEEPLEFSVSVQPIELSRREAPVGSKVTICGWGTMHTDDRLTERMRFNKQIHILDPISCKFATGSIYHKGLLCLAHSFGSGACNVSGVEYLSMHIKNLTNFPSGRFWWQRHI